jgi:hypothetical protein
LTGLLEHVSALEAGLGNRATQDGSGAARGTFRREGQFWTVAYGPEMARLRDLKGLRYVGLLLGAAGREVHVMELVTAAEGAARGDGVSAAFEELSVSRLGTGEAVLDPAAKDAYRTRLRELSEDLEEARSWNDPERAARLEQEVDALTAELESAFGLGGHDRSMPSAAERARVSVTKAIGVALRAISKDCPRLGEHLATSLRTGRLCSYAPPGQEPPAWDL